MLSHILCCKYGQLELVAFQCNGPFVIFNGTSILGGGIYKVLFGDKIGYVDT